MNIASLSKHGQPPAEIELIYQRAGEASHVFTASGIPGFYYSSSSMETSFNEAADALSAHISALFGVRAAYRLDMSFEDFRQHVDAEFSEDDDVSELILKNSVIAKMAGKNANICA